jgi:arsenate reductase-like glutaredoxin family protein
MLDRDLAELYGVETKYLKRQVKRNMIRFPEDFMFELTEQEFKEWRSQFVTSNEDKMGLRYAPYAFTEDGVAQLSTVLKSERAIKVNIQIIRLFSKMRKIMLTHKEILHKLEELERNDIEHDRKIELIFEYLKQFEEAKHPVLVQKERTRIGFKIKKD